MYVEDNGQGAEPESLKRAFEFGYSTKKRGSGFGLHDCANFIRFHKGVVELTSEGLKGGKDHFHSSIHQIKKRNRRARDLEALTLSFPNFRNQ